jgi:hypothetical protein
MGALTVAQITTRVQRQFGDTELAQILQSDVYNWINDCIREVVVQNDLLQTQSVTDGVANQKQYDLPTAVLKLRRVGYQGFPLRPLSVEEADQMLGNSGVAVNSGYPTGTPTHYWVYAGKINLYPAPANSGTGDIALNYTKYPTPVTTTSDVPELPAEYDNRIVEYCIAQAFELDTNMQVAGIKMGQFQQGIDKLKGNADWEAQDYYPSITTVGESSEDSLYGGTGWV